MRKRRRLANKMTIMVCAVLLAVSAFFYAPMEVSAEEIVFPTQVSGIIFEHFTNRFLGDSSYFDFVDSLHDTDDYYSFNVTFDVNITFSHSVASLRNFYLSYDDIFLLYVPTFNDVPRSVYEFSNTVNFICKGSDLTNGRFHFEMRALNGDVIIPEITINSFVDYTINNITPLTGEESVSYQQGYNFGYSAGEEAGESNGYSSGYSDGYNNGYGAGKTNGYESGYEQGSNDGYNSGFQAGVDSVDTQSYYDAGYQAGYDTGYAIGYDTGYDEGFATGYDEGYDSGYAKAMSRLENAGTDTNDYPILLGSANNADWGSWMIPVSIDTADLQTVVASYDDTFVGSINPNHTYKLIGTVGKLDFVDNFGYSTVSTSELWLNIGGHDYLVKSFVNGNQLVDVEIYIPGDSITSNFAFQAIGYNVSLLGSNTYTLLYCDFEYNLQLYDMGPSGDTQNHIANQTDQLTHGYDDSKGNTVNSELSTGLNEFETAENNLFATATTGMKDFSFFDFESVPAMLTAVTFITSIMGSWFEQAGGASGVGIVLSILFSVMLVSMVLGLYRLYQSAGHRAEARERHRESMDRWKKGK